MPRGAQPRPIVERLWEKVDKDGPVPADRPELGPCWVWTAGSKVNGYGRIWDGRMRMAHVVAWELAGGAIPGGQELDHLCRNPLCVNPAHLEPVTRRVNILRGEAAAHHPNRRKTQCRRGHAFDATNTYVAASGYRRCRACAAEDQRELRRSRAARKQEL